MVDYKEFSTKTNKLNKLLKEVINKNTTRDDINSVIISLSTVVGSVLNASDYEYDAICDYFFGLLKDYKEMVVDKMSEREGGE